MTSATTDPRPTPPERPLPGDCCGSGCARCVYVIYEEEMDAYREALQEWERRQLSRGKSVDASQSRKARQK
ncbi:MAG TPA: oxidoreductase-like domain-containing protein [Noviherbaspirillum sp.]|nr:oxidoreductase-like domain-containing protein [Noviherbaspirillum sp.]